MNAVPEFTPMPDNKPIRVRAFKVNTTMRVFIPKPVVSDLGWHVGDVLGLRAAEDGIRIRIAPAEDIDTLRRPLARQERYEACYVNIPLSVLSVMPKLPEPLAFEVQGNALIIAVLEEAAHAH